MAALPLDQVWLQIITLMLEVGVIVFALLKRRKIGYIYMYIFFSQI